MTTTGKAKLWKTRKKLWAMGYNNKYMKYTLRKIIEDNEKNFDFDFTDAKREADFLESVLPKSTSLKTKIHIASSLMSMLVINNKQKGE